MNAIFKNSEEISTSLKAGDEKIFRLIYDEYWEKLVAMSYNRLKSIELSEEIVQDIFTELWIKRESIVFTKNIEAYFVAALKYKIYNHIRHEKVKELHIQHLINTSDFSENSTWQQISFEELFVKMENQVNNLPEKCQIVFRLSRDNGYSNKEISQKLNISPKTVEVHIGKALKVLRSGLKEYVTILSIWFNIN